MSVSKITLMAVIVASVAATAAAGIKYEFQQIKRSSQAGEKPTILIGEAIIDGEKSRIEYLEGSSVGVGQYVVTTNGGRDTTIVDPATMTYYTRSAVNTTEPMRRLDIEVRNFEWDSQMLGTGPEIAGYPTEHHRIRLEYDLVLSIGPLEMTNRIETVIDKYTTLAFGDVGSAFYRDGLPTTGNPGIDRIIESQALRIPGFPLRQTVRTTSTVDEKTLPRNSQIPLERQKVQTTEMTVTSIERIGVKPGVFQIPLSYSRIEGTPLLPAVGELSPVTEENTAPQN